MSFFPSSNQTKSTGEIEETKDISEQSTKTSEEVHNSPEVRFRELKTFEQIDDGFWFPFVIETYLSSDQKINEQKKQVAWPTTPINAFLVHDKRNENNLNSIKVFVPKAVDEFTSGYIEKIPVGYISKDIANHLVSMIGCGQQYHSDLSTSSGSQVTQSSSMVYRNLTFL